MHSDQTRKYGISESQIQALYYNYVVIIIGLVLWIQRCHTFPFDHYASSAWCIIHAVLAYNVSSLFCYNYYDIHCSWQQSHSKRDACMIHVLI